jgi:hypothetical protein
MTLLAAEHATVRVFYDLPYQIRAFRTPQAIPVNSNPGWVAAHCRGIGVHLPGEILRTVGSQH